MTAFIRRILMTLLGLTGALAAWGSLELLLYFGENLGGYLFLSIGEGVVLGLFFGFSFGTAEGILLSDRRRALKGGLSGALTGIAAGALVTVIIQGLLISVLNTELFSRETADRIILPLCRTLGWMLLGAAVGSIEGFRGRSPRRAGIGVLGGLTGGLAGGIVLEFLARIRDSGFTGRGMGILIMGGAIGLFYSLFESARSFGILKVLSGRIRGKEYIISMRKTILGSSGKSALDLSGYNNIKANHALFLAGREGVILEAREGDVLVNEERTKKKNLKYEDVIQIGSVKLLYLPVR